VLLPKDVALAEGIVAFGLLVLLQYAITCSSVRSDRVRALVKAEPCLLLRDGRFLHGEMRRERVTEDEVQAAARTQGIESLNDVAAAVLETDGSFSVIRRDSNFPGKGGHPSSPVLP
jgi:uncharacterized membrane protein YcaP (DUF421 family)